MSVEPGFGGQAFLDSALPKIKAIREIAPNLPISVDGGINARTATLCREAGADVLVAGSYFFALPTPKRRRIPCGDDRWTKQDAGRLNPKDSSNRHQM